MFLHIESHEFQGPEDKLWCHCLRQTPGMLSSQHSVLAQYPPHEIRTGPLCSLEGNGRGEVLLVQEDCERHAASALDFGLLHFGKARRHAINIAQAVLGGSMWREAQATIDQPLPVWQQCKVCDPPWKKVVEYQLVLQMTAALMTVDCYLT